jgi:mannose-6-phosphate isomerase-like protein (cupin superfamily)
VTPQKVNLAEAFSSFSDHWSPKIAGDINDMQVKLAKFQGKFDWHHHEDEDELFLVIRGTMRMGLRTGDVDVGEGELIIIPHGIEHRPEALDDECHVLMLEPKSILNTGNVISEKTVRKPDRI